MNLRATETRWKSFGRDLRGSASCRAFGDMPSRGSRGTDFHGWRTLRRISESERQRLLHLRCTCVGLALYAMLWMPRDLMQVYIQSNRLVSLAGLKSFKFLRVPGWLSGGGNLSAILRRSFWQAGTSYETLTSSWSCFQGAVLRGLDTMRRSEVLRFPFLKKLELFDNPVPWKHSSHLCVEPFASQCQVAEEPDYRLRLIYHVPQAILPQRKQLQASCASGILRGGAPRPAHREGRGATSGGGGGSKP